VTSSRALKAPKHLRPPTRRWWLTVVDGYELEEHHLRLLTMIAEAWDRKEAARTAIVREGLVFTDRFGSPKPRPEVAVQRDAEIVFARLPRELKLDIDPPEDTESTLTTRGRRFLGQMMG
jgi:phage terminase small subunit